ncbi:hypothetical protein WSK_2382 [Novosphingobium sp. Rr 2-17]|uniref:hypothetical protein n=1 Tax=Novosphingobium sp. Rr 2-17 TaxID=555793 RepID=UPI000269A50D|nr:hypothetical protein [Novosphingobium sp. Rr 2-17]EIZ78839.1 hypothetical protein WSK_2382 [Novosphingobium sp. Rr 2-17]
MMSTKFRVAALLLPLVATACGTTGKYPSLAIRNVERVSGSAPGAPGTDAAPPAALPPASADLTTRLQGLVASARDANERFQAKRPAAERAADAAGAVGTDSWSSGSVALGVLEGSRSQAMVAMGELDVLYADARDAAPTDESPSALAIGEARKQVGDWIAAQDAVLATLAGKLKT